MSVVVTEVRVENFLSLKDLRITLGPLSVLVGPNGGGKSNFLAVFRFLGEVARTDLVPALEQLFGGFGEAVFRGEKARPSITIALDAQATDHASPTAPDQYRLTFRPVRSGRALTRTEAIVLKRSAGPGRRITLSGGKIEFQNEVTSGRGAPKQRETPLDVSQEATGLSVLRRVGVASDTKQVNQLAEVFENLRLFDPVVPLARRPSPANDQGPLRADAANLASFLLRLSRDAPDVFEALQDDMRDVLPGFRSFEFSRLGGAEETVVVGLSERGLAGTTALARASFGTVRAVALFALLRDPDPPRLTCMEEVDHGLHPHALDILVDRLREASKRTQIVVATHSPALVNRLEPDELRVFERDSTTGATRVADLPPKQIAQMRQDSGFDLGELWFSGLLGGTPR